MSQLTIEPVPCFFDNYAWLIIDREDGICAVVDPSEAEPVSTAVRARGLALTHILNTHHHFDHVGGNNALKSEFGATIIGARKDRDRLPGLDVALDEGDILELGSHTASVLEIPAHTSGHIAFWFADDGVVFPGDTLFAMGCGKILEGDAPMMWNSLSKLAVLPDHTSVYCAHEYTEKNGRFALTLEPGNADLQARMEDVRALRKAGKPTLPTTIGLEHRTNPFFRAASPEIRKTLELEGAGDAGVFAEARRRKDRF